MLACKYSISGDEDIQWGKMNFVVPVVFVRRRVGLPLSGMYRLVPWSWKDSGLG